MDFTPFKNHLDFLGYKTREEHNDDVHILFAESATNPNLSITKNGKRPFLLIRSNWSITKVPANMYELINRINQNAVNVSSVWHYLSDDKTPCIGVSSAYFGEYKKDIFAEFLDVFLGDVRRLPQREEMKDML